MLSVNIFEILSHQNIALYGINGRDALSYDIAYRDVYKPDRIMKLNIC